MTLFDLLSYKKSIWLYPNGFSFVDASGTTLRQQYYAYAYGYNLREQAEQFFNFADSEAEEVSVVVAMDVPAIVPADFQGDKDPLEMLELLVDKAQVAQTFQWTAGQDNWIYFIRNKEKEALDSLSQHWHFVSSFEMIQQFLQQNEHKDDMLWVSEGDGFADFYLLKDGKTALVNRFAYQQTEDVLYMILNVMQQYGLGNEAPVCLHKFVEQSSLLPLAQKYVKNLNVIE